MCPRAGGDGQPHDAGRGSSNDTANGASKGSASSAWPPRRSSGPPKTYGHGDENALTFVGFLLFFDPPKADAQQAIADLAQRGVQLKIITGDNHKVARHVAEAVGLPLTGVLTGGDLDNLHEEALWHLAERTTLFAEVDPNQKERIILALQKTGHVVGYMGDGINDASALHAADVGLSVDTAVDVAKDAADFVLLGKSLDILRQGIDEGRAHLRQYDQVHPHHHQRELWQHVQHGRGVDCSCHSCLCWRPRSCSTTFCPTSPPPPSPATMWTPSGWASRAAGTPSSSATIWCSLAWLARSLIS